MIWLFYGKTLRMSFSYGLVKEKKVYMIMAKKPGLPDVWKIVFPRFIQSSVETSLSKISHYGTLTIIMSSPTINEFYQKLEKDKKNQLTFNKKFLLLQNFPTLNWFFNSLQ